MNLNTFVSFFSHSQTKPKIENDQEEECFDLGKNSLKTHKIFHIKKRTKKDEGRDPGSYKDFFVHHIYFLGNKT